MEKRTMKFEVLKIIYSNILQYQLAALKTINITQSNEKYFQLLSS